MMGMASGIKPWKTVILETDRNTDSTGGRTDLWFTFLGIDQQNDLDKYAYVCFFSNNQSQTSYPADFILWTEKALGSNVCLSVRGDWTNSGTSWNRSEFATAGTQIDIYRIPKQFV